MRRRCSWIFSLKFSNAISADSAGSPEIDSRSASETRDSRARAFAHFVTTAGSKSGPQGSPKSTGFFPLLLNVSRPIRMFLESAQTIAGPCESSPPARTSGNLRNSVLWNECRSLRSSDLTRRIPTTPRSLPPFSASSSSGGGAHHRISPRCRLLAQLAHDQHVLPRVSL